LRNAAAQELMAEIKGKKQKASSDLQQRSFEELSEYLEYDPMAYRTPDLERGRRVFMTSRCADCHVFGSIGRGGGPDLSTVTSRFRRRDILESIMDPSKTISDQYAAVDVTTKYGALTTGMVVEEDETTLTLITVRGERVEIDKGHIVDRYDSKISIMPDGLLDTMSRGDLVQLMHFLERGADL
jgi:putative heme-binding domain-containing protein